MATEHGFCRKRNWLKSKKRGRQTGIKNSLPGIQAGCSTTGENRDLSEAAAVFGREEKGKEMNIQLYISFDSVTKITSSKTLWRLGQQKIDALFLASLSFS